MLTTAKGRDLVISLPRDRVLTETDGPFAMLDGRTVEPRDVVRTTGLLARLWDVPAAEAERQVGSNLGALLSGRPGDEVAR